MVDQERNRDEQTQLYGESLDGVVRRLNSTLSLTQAQLAEVLGISAPMLSQLVTAKRVKIGNPAALRRLEALQDLSEQVTGGLVPMEEIPHRLAEVRQVSGQWTRSQQVSVPQEPEQDVPATIGLLLRDVASGRQLRGAVELLGAHYPELARFLQVYGLGSPEEAEQHFRAHQDQ